MAMRMSMAELEVISPVQVGEKVSARFAFAKKFEIDLRRAELFVEAVETQQMVFRPLRRVFRGAVGLDQKSPIARLGQKQLARGLPERALDRGITSGRDAAARPPSCGG